MSRRSSLAEAGSLLLCSPPFEFSRGANGFNGEANTVPPVLETVGNLLLVSLVAWSVIKFVLESIRQVLLLNEVPRVFVRILIVLAVARFFH